MRPTLVTRGSRLILKTGPFDSFTSCSLGFRVSAWTTIERNLSIRNDWPPLPSLEGARHNYRTGRVVTQASASASTLSGRLERLRESLAVMGMDCEDPKADVVESRGSRGELFDPDDLRRTRDARLIRQEDFDFQPRTHLRLLIRVDAQTAETRIDPPASAEKAQDRPREIYGCSNARVQRAPGTTLGARHYAARCPPATDCAWARRASQQPEDCASRARDWSPSARLAGSAARLTR